MKFLFQGDSITDGNRCKDKNMEWDKNHQIGHSYAYLLTAYLSLKYFERNYVFINRGVSGNTTEDLLLRWQVDCIDITPDVLILLIGTNDICYQKSDVYDTDMLQYKQNYRELLLQIKVCNPNVRIVLLEPFGFVSLQPKDVSGGEVERATALKNVQKIVSELSAEFNAMFVPLQTAFDEMALLSEAKYWIWDGIHPTEAGHALIAKEVLRKLELLF